jgi:pyruvate/2-oxoglutarate dehydrogenase complex dihydrolipoamide acyltransferase (E2) component
VTIRNKTVIRVKTTIDLNNNWRKVASVIYNKTSDSKILGMAEVDVTDLEVWLAQKRKAGIKVTITHVLTLAAARALRFEVPELNVYARRGKIVKRPQIDAVVSVLLEGSEMGSVKIPRADTVTIDEAVQIMASHIKEARTGARKSDHGHEGQAGCHSLAFPEMDF